MKWMLLVFSIFAISGTASAAVITGSIDFNGGYTTDTGNKDTATVFTFLNPIDVTAASGSFAPLSGGTVTYNALDINSLPASPLWSATVGAVNYSYDLNSITLDQVVSSFRVIEGTGMFTIGTDTQLGTWSLSTQDPGIGGTFSFSASQEVPVPAAAWLFGSGLLGLVGMARRKKAA